MNLFSYDSPFMTECRKLVDYTLLGLLWLLACLPIITYGAATTAAFRTAETSLYKGNGTVFMPFWKNFANEFKEATILWLIQVPVLAILIISIWLLFSDQYSTTLTILGCIASIIIFCWIQLWFPYLSKFEDRITMVLRNTFHMTLGHLGRSILLCIIHVVFIVAAVLVLLFLTPLLLLIPGGFILAYTTAMRRYFTLFVTTEENVECA